MFVYQAMSPSMVAIGPKDSAAHAARELLERDITGLPVVDEGGRVLGVVTELDLLRAVRDGLDLGQVTVRAVMDPRPLFVEPETDLNTAIEVMDEWRVRRLPVCVERRLVGIVSRGDLLRGLAHRDGRSVAARMPAEVLHGSGQPCACVSMAQAWELGGEV